MSMVEIVLVGLALSADAMSVTICNILANPRMRWSRQMAMPILFGLFQGLMPLAGYFAGDLAASFFERYAGIVTFLILGIIGGKMIWDAFHGGDEGKEDVSFKVMLLQAVATSIDAFAVGVSFVAMQVNVWLAVSVIACCTFFCCFSMLLVGRKVGPHLGQRAQVIGGVILILIGIKSLWF